MMVSTITFIPTLTFTVSAYLGAKLYTNLVRIQLSVISYLVDTIASFKQNLVN